MATPATSTVSGIARAGCRSLMISDAWISPNTGTVSVGGRSYFYAMEWQHQIGLSPVPGGPACIPEDVGVGAVCTFT